MKNIITERINLEVADGTAMSAYVARPDMDLSRRGMLVFQEAFGVNAHIRDVTERFAREGYVAVAPELFHRTSPGFEGSYADFESVRPHLFALQIESMIADITAAHGWLRQNAHGGIASIGFCMGGRASFLANTCVSLKAAVSFYGGSIPALLDRVPLIGGPVLMLWGGLDKNIPVDDTRKVVDALKAGGKEYVSIEFSNANHGFFCDARASYDPQAAAQAWGLVLDFFEANLDGKPQ